MRVLFTPFPAATHVNVQAPLAWALRSQGHEVRVASQPDVLDQIMDAGLTAVPIGEVLDLQTTMNPDYGDQVDEIQDDAWLDVLDITETRPERLTYDYVHGVLTAWTAFVYQNTVPDQVIDDMVAFARDWRPDLVIWDTMYYAGAVAAQVTGAAHARLMFGLDLVGLMRQQYHLGFAGLPPQLREDPLAEWLGRTLERHGSTFSEQVAVGQWTIDPVPSTMRLPVDLHYQPMRFVPYNGRGVVPDWLREPPRKRRVCLTLGVSFREVAGGDRASIGELLEAVAGLDVEVVATLNADQLKELPQVPENVRVVDFVPMDALLPTCSAIVHHGGSGTSQTALLHGVPQVMVPTKMWCNVPKAERVEQAGAGLWCEPENLTAARLREMLLRVLDEPSFAAGAARVRDEMLATPSPGDLVPQLEKLTAEHRRG
ncbi:activator-dependent family glycosyltransferase [Micromonospora ureilytica]|uniref:activator-dependent family glycosyltransferase n=1 Tax=Micromonospora ureilytica TaxID=709868 RepID=UPI0033FE9A92